MVRTLLVIFFILLPQLAISETLRIGLSLGITGKYSSIAIKQRNGFLLWQEMVNRKDGILGKKVKLIIEDDKSDPNEAKRIYERLINEEKVDLLFAPYSSEITEAILPIVAESGYPIIISGASADRLWEKGYRNIFGLYSPASRYAVGFLEILVRYGIERIAILSSDDSFSLDLAKGVKMWADRFGLKTVLYEVFKKGEEKMDLYVMMAKNALSEAVIVCGHLDESMNVRLSLKRINWYPKAYFASVGPVLYDYKKRLSSDADLTFSSSMWEYIGGFLTPCCIEFYNEYIKRFKTEPSYHAAAAFAAGQLLEYAINKTGSFDKKKIINKLSSMDVLTILGRYGVDKRGLQVKHRNVIIQWQDGKKVVVWPKEIKNSEPIILK